MDKKNRSLVVSFTVAIIALVCVLALGIKLSIQETRMQTLADHVAALESANRVSSPVQQVPVPKTVEPAPKDVPMTDALWNAVISLETYTKWTASAVADLYAKQGRAYQQLFMFPNSSSAYEYQMYLPGPAYIYNTNSDSSTIVTAQLASGYGSLEIVQKSASECATSSITGAETLVINGVPFYISTDIGGGMESYAPSETFDAVLSGHCQEFTFRESFSKYCPTAEDPSAACDLVDMTPYYKKWANILKTLEKRNGM